MSLIAVDSRTSEILIPIGEWTYIEAEITTPADAIGAVLFVHGTGSNRHSPHTRYVAAQLNLLNFATVIADLGSGDEADSGASFDLRLDTTLRTERVEGLALWAHHSDEIGALPLGVFGSGTGAASALDAAALQPDVVSVVVSRSGRLDLAQHLPGVKAPTLLVVAEKDIPGIELNRKSRRFLNCPNDLRVIPGASREFAERGTVDLLAAASGAWFHHHLAAVHTTRR